MKRCYLSIFLGICSWLFGIQDVSVFYEAPTAEEFVTLRTAAGMRERSIASVEKAIPHTLFWVLLRDAHGKLIGMGRLVGDLGSFVALSDIAVHPEHQRKGCGRFILEALQEYILQEVSEDAFVCLFSNKAVTPFYEKHGFQFTEGKWPGMYWPNLERAKKKAISTQ